MKKIVFRETSEYLKFFKLKFHPFPVAPDDGNFYISSGINEIIEEIVHGIMTRKGFMVLTGDIGLGKTSIGRRIVSILTEKKVETAMVLNSFFRNAELIREINRDFGLNIGPSFASTQIFGDHLDQLNRFLLDLNQKGRNCAIIIDDAQNLTRSSLELIRMISNLEANQQKLVQILLIGQPELVDMLRLAPLRQLRSRIVIQKRTHPLTLTELRQYLMFKLNAAGNNGLITIERGAFRLIHRITMGNFRHLNILMDRVLYVGFLNHSRIIGGRTVQEAHKDIKSHSEDPKMTSFRWFLFIGGMTAVAVSVLFFSAGRFAEQGFLFSSKKKNIASYRIYSLDEKIVKNPNYLENKVFITARNGKDGNASGVSEKNDFIPSESPSQRPVREFLKTYNLLQYENEFQTALETGEQTKVSDKIFRKTGYMWIKSDTLYEFIKKRYGVLVHTAGDGRKPVYSLFWRPELFIDKFYYSYRGKEIFVLQRLLSKNRFYNDKLDGIVGSNLMRAILNFQRHLGLSITGFPDINTLFYLYHYEEEKTID